MDGVFMFKLIKLIICGVLIIGILSVVDLWKDKQTLKNNLLRLHVVANSDSEYDQQVKLQVKDAITEYLQPITEQFSNKEEAMEYIRENLESLQAFSNQVLDSLGVTDRAVVSLEEEAFGTREYETFSLPSGVYDALRIEIGEAEGKNWWCVVFPSLCLPATGAEFQEVAVSSGFDSTLTSTISNNGNYQIRFFFLDCIGKLENLFH